jgi:hypothetical protein
MYEQKDNKVCIETETSKQKQENIYSYIKMDFSIESPEDRVELVRKICNETPRERLTSRYLEKLADYIIFAVDKQEHKSRKYLTENRLVTINKNETSFEGLVGKLENGEDGIYNMMTNDKNIIMSHKVAITEKDIKEIPGMKELRETIADLQEQLKTARGKKAYVIKKQIINLSQDQYVLKNTYKKPIYNGNNVQSLIKSARTVDLGEHLWIDKERAVPQSDCFINLFNETHVSLLLCNYSKIKQECWTDFNSDIKWLMMDLDNLVDVTLKEKYRNSRFIISRLSN